MTKETNSGSCLLQADLRIADAERRLHAHSVRMADLEEKGYDLSFAREIDDTLRQSLGLLQEWRATLRSH